MSQTKAQLIGDLTQALEFITTASTPADGLYLKATNQIALATNSVDRITAGTSELVINESGASVDFRVEGDTNANLLFVDASTDRVGIGTSSPANDVDILKTASGSTTTARIGATATTGANNATLILNNGGTGNATLRFDYESSTNRASIGVLSSDQKLTFGTAGSTAMTIDASQRVGIGTTSPGFGVGSGLEIERAGSATLRIENTSVSSGFEIQNDGNITFNGYNSQPFIFTHNTTERARIDSSGRLLVGTSTARNNFFNGTWTPRIQAEASTDQACSVSLVSSSTGNNQAGLLILGASKSAIGGNGATDGTQGLGIVSFQGNDGSSMIETARVQCVAQGTPSTDNVPARLVFSTNSGSGAASERMRIQPNGYVNINKLENQTVSQLFVGSGGSISFTGSDQSFGSGGNRGFVDIDGTTARFGALGGGASWTRGVTLWVSNNSTSAAIGLEVPAAGITSATTASAANVHVDGSNILRRSTSSRKYKTNIETIENYYSDALLNVRPVWYRSTADADNPDHGFWGFIAEEVAEIDPRLVNFKTYTETFDDQGNSTKTPLDTPEPEGVQYDRFVPHLLNLVKRQKEQIEAMEARLATLEAN